MTARKPTSPSNHQDHGNKLKDEVYRQMFRLEANRRGADLDLATTLLRGWLDSYSNPETAKLLEWLKKISPLCLHMIEAKQQPSDVGRERIH